MKPSRKITIVASLMLIVCLAASVMLLQRLDQVRSGATLEEVLYISSPQALKRLSLGYDGLLADIYWTRAVQYFGQKHFAGATRYDLLAPLLEITTALDPHLTVAYEFGSTFLAAQPPNGAGLPQKAIALTEYGIRENPDEWRLYYDLGFIYYMELKDYKGAADAFARGSRVPNAHPWLKLMAAQMAEHAGDLQTARMMWVATYQTTTDKSVRANAAAHLRAIRAQDDVTVPVNLGNPVGHLPSSFADLQATGMLRGVPVDPVGHPYQLLPDGHVEVRVPDDIPFLQKGTPPGYVPPKAPKFLPSD